MKETLLSVLIPLSYVIFLPLVLGTQGQPGFSSSPVIILGLVLSILGLVLWLGGMVSLGRSFGVLPVRQTRVTRGLYRFLSHPIYWGIFLTFLGISFCLGSLWGIFYDFLVIGLVSIVRARREEKLLIDFSPRVSDETAALS